MREAPEVANRDEARNEKNIAAQHVTVQRKRCRRKNQTSKNRKSQTTGRKARRERSLTHRCAPGTPHKASRQQIQPRHQQHDGKKHGVQN
jgi:hypothetical protein